MSEHNQNPSNDSLMARASEKYKGLDRWAQVATILAVPLIAVGSFASMAALNPSNPKPSPPSSVSFTPQTPSQEVSTASPTQSPSATDSESGIPAADLGSWGGFLRQDNGLTERIIMNLNQGAAGDEVGTFSNQTANCQGAIYLNGDTEVTLSGVPEPAADLDLETTQNPGDVCTPSAEVYIASANGSTLVLDVVTEGTAQGSLEDPLAVADLTH
jgi:hypothetical protein